MSIFCAFYPKSESSINSPTEQWNADSQSGDLTKKNPDAHAGGRRPVAHLSADNLRDDITYFILSAYLCQQGYLVNFVNISHLQTEIFFYGTRTGVFLPW